MMYGMDKDRLHLWMGLTHPVFGPANLAWYMAFLTMSQSYGCYVAWIDTFINSTYRDRTSSDKPRNPG
jgi:hypothetical protein